MNTFQRICSVALLASTCVLPAAATTLAPLTVEQMTDASDLIVRGRVTEVWTELDEHSHLWTRAEVEVTTGLKGRVAAGDVLVVDAAGGTANDGSIHEVPLAARYGKGEDVFLFLAETRFGTHYDTVAMSNGKFTVKQDPRDGVPMLVKFTVPQAQVWDPRFVPNPAVDKRVSLASMEGLVKTRVDLGWDGKPIPGISGEKLRTINRLQAGVR